MRGGAVTLADAITREVATGGRPDVLMVSSMVDLAALVGLARRSLVGVPVALYLHENQLTHPLGPGQRPDEGIAWRTWASLVAADAVWVNSEFQRDGLLAALPALLARAPDRPHHHHLTAVRERMSVLPVGIELADVPHERALVPREGPLVLWNHRWDHDKAPRVVLDALVALAEEGVPFRVALAGENTRVDPREFHDARVALGERVVRFGHVASRAEYVEMLGRADVVVSAARQEFFGISVVEAVAAGAVPVVPDRLSYPEVLGPLWAPACCYPDGGLLSRLRAVFTDLDRWRAATEGLAEALRARYTWEVIAPRYDQALDASARGDDPSASI
jgi:glycosyltransferase involved in cell wall biosynthesis